MADLYVHVDDATLAASYSPAGDAALIALHGASEGQRSFFLYKRLHEVLPRAGIGVVTFDRRGQGESTGNPSVGDFRRQATDALAIRDALDVARVGLWGWSQGGWVAPIAAASSPRIAFLVLIASTGVTPAEQMRFYTAQQLRGAGYDETVVTRALDLRFRYEARVHGAHGDDLRLRADLRQAALEPWFEKIYIPGKLPGEDDVLAWIDEMDFDPRPVFEQVRVPSLALYGGADAVSPVAESVVAWQSSGADVEVHVIDRASHDLTLADGTLAPQYERTMIDWLRRRVL